MIEILKSFYSTAQCTKVEKVTNVQFTYFFIHKSLNSLVIGFIDVDFYKLCLEFDNFRFVLLFDLGCTQLLIIILVSLTNSCFLFYV